MRSDPFYAAAFLAIAAMLWSALTPGLQTMTNLQRQLERVELEGWVIDSDALAYFTPTSGTSSEVVSEGGFSHALLKATRGPNEGVPSAGVFQTLPPAVGRLFADRPTRVSLTVRRTQDQGSDRFLAAYFVLSGPSSGWVEFEPGDTYAEYSFEWTPPAGDLDRPALIGVWPDADGDGGGVELRRILVEPL